MGPIICGRPSGPSLPLALFDAKGLVGVTVLGVGIGESEGSGWLGKIGEDVFVGEAGLLG